MGMTDYLEQQLGNHLFRDAAFTKPTTLYMGLFTTLPTADDGTGGIECPAASYGRVAYGPSNTHWTEPVDGNGEFYNLFSIIFPTPQEDWGTIVGWGLFDADLANGGNLLIFSPLASNKNVPNGAPAPEFNPGAVKFTFN
jgi:hypothetical protein